MRNKKRVLSLFLAMMMVFLVFTEHMPFSFAQNDSDPVEYGPSNIESDKIKVTFKNGKTLMSPDVGVISEELDGLAFPIFKVEVDLSELSSGNKRIKEGDSFRLSMPLNMELRDFLFKNASTPFVLKDEENNYAEYAVVTNDVVKNSAKEVIKNDLVITFKNDSSKNFIVKEKRDIKFFFEFESTAIIPESGNVDFEFAPPLKVPTLSIKAKRYLIFTKHLLKKTVGGVEVTADKENVLYRFSLFANRKGEKLTYPEIYIKDTIVNETKGALQDQFNFSSVHFDKLTFQIRKGTFDPNKESDFQPNSVLFETKGREGEFVPNVAENTQSITLDGGNLILTLNDIDKPQSFKLTIKNPGETGYKVTYAIKVPIEEVGNGYSISNSYDLYDDKNTMIDLGYTDENPKPKAGRELQFLASGGITAGNRGTLTVVKKDADSSAPIQGVTFKLYQDGVDTTIKKTTGSDGVAIFDDLVLGKDEDHPIVYTVEEVGAPRDYQPIIGVLSESVNLHKKGTGAKSNTTGTIDVTNIRKKIDITVHKKWSDSSSQKKDVTFTLKRRVEGEEPSQALKVEQVGVDATKTLAATENSVEFKGLYEYDGNGKKYIYTVEEEKVEGYTSDSPQDVDENTHEVTITNTPVVIPKGSIKIIKADADNPSTTLKNAVFKVTNTTGYDGQFTTADDGTVVVSDLVYGEYTIEEITAPEGYELNTTPKSVTINSETEQEVRFTNKKTIIPKGKITIAKKDDSGKLLDGVNFSLKNLETSEVIGPKATVNGVVVFEDLDLGSGADKRIEYEVLETTPIAYQKPTVNPTVELDETHQEKSIEVSNIRKKIDIRVNKTWVGTGATEQDVIFTLKRHIEGGIAEEFEQDGKTFSETLKADDLANNFVQFTGLHKYDESGKEYIYTVGENSIAGYHSNAPVQVVGGVANIINTIIPKGTIAITKLEKGTATKIEGAKFSITKDDTPITGSPFTTNSEGEITVSDLKMGTYIITEIEVPDKYRLDSKPITVELKDEVEKMSAALKIENEKKAGSIKIKKVEAIMKSALQGAEFTITNSGGVQVGKVTSGADGFAKVEGLELGKYTISEIKAPSGYDADSKIYTVEIKEDNEEVELTVENRVKPAPPSGGTTPPPSDDSTPPPSDGGGSGTPGTVEKITPQPPKPEEPKKEEPKPEEPQPPADGIGGPGEPPSEPSEGGVGGFEPPSEPFIGITGSGAGSGENETNVLPGMIPGLTGGGSTAGNPNSAVDPGYVGRLPKTGEGLNSSTYALLFAALGMGFVLYGIYRRKKC